MGLKKTREKMVARAKKLEERKHELVFQASQKLMDLLRAATERGRKAARKAEMDTDAMFVAAIGMARNPDAGALTQDAAHDGVANAAEANDVIHPQGARRGDPIHHQHDAPKSPKTAKKAPKSSKSPGAKATVSLQKSSSGLKTPKSQGNGAKAPKSPGN